MLRVLEELGAAGPEAALAGFLRRRPKATFASTSVARNGDGYDVTGDLTQHGIAMRANLEISLQALRAS